MHLNHKGLKVFGDVFLKEISNIFDRHYIDKNHAGCKSNFLLEDEKRIDAKTVLKTIRREYTNELVFPHINIDTIRNKFEFLVNQVN